MKVLIDKYPMGSLPNQKTAGRYVDGTLYQNVEIMARNIIRDMTFLIFVFSSTLEVGTGKSVFVSQMGEIWTELINKMHNQNIKFDITNCVFKPKDLIERAFKLPKYSCIVLDEWEDLHYMSELGMSLRQFFRKCRQLNLLIICIIPNFFQLPSNYAISRSVAAIDVKFVGEFERGYFDFYSFKKKKDLYVYGKKTQDYNAARPDFIGRFTDGYGWNEKEYRAAKLKDMLDSEKPMVSKIDEKNIRVKLFYQMYNNSEGITIKKLSEMFGISVRTGERWIKEANNNISPSTSPNNDNPPPITTNLIERDDDGDEVEKDEG